MAAQPAAAPQAASGFASPSVYVGNLDARVTEAMLYEHFRATGPVVSVRVCIDSASQKSLGYGYVNFQNAGDADRAIDQLNGSRLQDRAICVARVLRDPTLRKSGVTNIVVKGLPQDADAKNLKEVFGKFGSIVSIKLSTDDTGKPRGMAYIMFDKEASATQAVDEVNGKSITEGGPQLSVERYRSPAVMQQELMQKFTNLYVKNLAPTTTDQQLNDAFAAFGTITSAKIRAEADTGKAVGVGFGWVAFDDHEAAVRATEALDGKDHALAAPGQTLCVRRFQTKKERVRNREVKHRERIAQYSKYPNLYVKNFDDDITEEQMKVVFDKFGETVSVKIAMDPTTKTSRGFAFVSFHEASAAQKAVTELTGSQALGKRPLYITYAQRRDLRRQQQEELFRKRSARAMQPFPGPSMNPMMMQHPSMMGHHHHHHHHAHSMFQPQPMMAPMGGLGGFRMPPQLMQQRNPMMGGPMGMHPQMMHPGAGMFQPGGMPPNMMGMNPAMMRPAMAPRPAPAAPQRAPMPQAPAPQHQAGLDATYLASMTQEQQKNVLGERLYSYIIKINPNQAAKITGMLLEIDNFEILNLLDSPEQLNGKIREAQEVLDRHGGM
mgnify:CR=1